DRVEGNHAGPRPVRYVEGAHVALLERHPRVQGAGLPDHGRGEIDADDLQAAVVEIAADVAGSAADVADGSGTAYGGGEPVEELAVQRLVPQLVVDPPDVLLGHAIVARPDEALVRQFQR